MGDHRPRHSRLTGFAGLEILTAQRVGFVIAGSVPGMSAGSLQRLGDLGSQSEPVELNGS
jgi:hypothetical protein